MLVDSPYDAGGLLCYPPLQRAHHMMVDDTQIVVEWEVERVLPGWIPRRLGQLLLSSLDRNFLTSTWF